MFKPRNLTLALLIACCLAPVLSAQDAEKPAIERHLTDTTIGFARVRLDRFEINPLMQFIADKVPAPQDAKQQALAGLMGLNVIKGQLVSAGATELYIVVDLEHFLSGPYLLIEFKPGSDPASLINLLKMTGLSEQLSRDTIFETLGNVLYLGHQKILPQVKANRTATRPALDSAFATVADYPVQVIVCPTTDQLRAMRETVPSFPAPYHVLNGDVLSRAVRSIALGGRIEPELGIKLVISGDDEQSSETLLAVLQQAFAFALEQQPMLKNFPLLKKFGDRFPLERNGKQLSLSLVADEQLLDELANFAGSPLKQLQNSAQAKMVQNNLKQFGLAMHNWNDVYSVFPAHANYSKEGKPLLSWRVHLLPYLDQQALYKEFHLDEPWDSAHNKPLIEQMPQIFAIPDLQAAGKGKTGYVLPILQDGSAITTGTKDGNQFSDITDGTSNTVLLVVANEEHAVIWTKPDDLIVDPENPLASLQIVNGVFQCLTADGAAHRIPATIEPAMWLKILTRNGGEITEWPKW